MIYTIYSTCVLVALSQFSQVNAYSEPNGVGLPYLENIPYLSAQCHKPFRNWELRLERDFSVCLNDVMHVNGHADPDTFRSLVIVTSQPVVPKTAAAQETAPSSPIHQL